MLTRSFVRDLSALAITVMTMAACGQAPPPDHEPSAPTLLTASVATPVKDELAAWADVEASVHGDAERGKALVARFECSRCHAGTGQPTPVFDRHCVGCHQVIAAGTLPFARERVEAWKSQTRHYITTPGLATLGATLRPSWIAGFLHEPVKIRPHEEEWMPRLAISEGEARDMAAFLTAGSAAPHDVHEEGDATRGMAVVGKKGCFLCHEFTGADRADVTMEVPSIDPQRLAKGMTQAPDLRLARERFRPDALAQWIRDPKSLRRDATMPTLGLTAEESRDAAAYILRTPLSSRPVAEPPIVRLPVLEQRVTYEQVASRVFRKSCTHCHADSGSKGNPGPGNTGGFGFAARGVSLLSFRGTQQGYIASGGARKSLFVREPALEKWGGARLVAALVARHEETAGRPVAEVRGMPMGLPGLSPEETQLVETWVAQGAKE